MSNAVLVTLISSVSAIAVGYMPIARDWVNRKASNQDMSQLEKELLNANKMIEHQTELIDELLNKLNEMSE